MKKLKYLPILLAVILTNCQTLRSVVQDPKLSLSSVDFAGISLAGIDMIAHIDVENPNGFSIPMPKIDWELFVNTASFLQGVIPSDASIKSGGKVTLDLPLSVTYEGLYKTVASLLETKEAAYNIAMGVTFPIPFLESRVFDLAFSGVLPLPELPKLSPEAVRISKIDFSGIELECGVNVENPNAFPIPFPKIDYDYGINGVSVLKSSLAGAGTLAAGAKSLAHIKLGVTYADILRLVDSAKNAKEARSNLSMQSDSPIPVLAGVKNVLDIPGTLPILRKPEIAFKGITRKTLGTTMEFILNWEVDNQNLIDFAIGEFIYDFKVNNSQWAKGKIDNPPELKAAGKTLIPLNVSISAASMVREIADIIRRGGSVNYTSTGNMNLTGNFPGLEKIELPLNFTGNTLIR